MKIKALALIASLMIGQQPVTPVNAGPSFSMVAIKSFTFDSHVSSVVTIANTKDPITGLYSYTIQFQDGWQCANFGGQQPIIGWYCVLVPVGNKLTSISPTVLPWPGVDLANASWYCDSFTNYLDSTGKPTKIVFSCIDINNLPSGTSPKVN